MCSLPAPRSIADFASVISEHRFNLVFEDEVGDLARCSCGEQGYDFEQGWEWYGKHVLARLAPPHPDAEAADTATGGTR